MQLEEVIKGLLPVAHQGTYLVFNHHNYYCWNGHHMKPGKPSALDVSDEEQKRFFDWAHVYDVDQFKNDHYINTSLNKITLNQLRDIVDKYFEIEVWEEKKSANDVLARLTEDIESKVYNRFPNLTRNDLEVNVVLCVAKKRFN